MSTMKKCKVVLLPTNKEEAFKEGSIILTFDTLDVITKMTENLQIQIERGRTTIQHIYIISDEEIKKGDFLVHNYKRSKCTDVTSEGRLMLEGINNLSIKMDVCKKVIASTDSTLGLPQPSQEFIGKYVSKYNQHNRIDYVMISYVDNGFEDWKGSDADGEPVWVDKFDLKVNPKDNTITIKPVKENWSTQEVIDILKKREKDLSGFAPEDAMHIIPLEEWINDNL